MSARANGTTSSYGRRAAGGEPFGAGDLHPAALVGHEAQQRLERLLVEPGGGVDACHVVDHVRARASRRAGRRSREGPWRRSAARCANRTATTRSTMRQNTSSSGAPPRWATKLKRVPRTPAIVERGDVGVGERLVDHRHAGVATRPADERVDHGRVVGAVAARLHEDGARQTETLLQNLEVVDAGVGRRVGAIGGERERVARPEDVAVRVARAWRRREGGGRRAARDAAGGWWPRSTGSAPREDVAVHQLAGGAEDAGTLGDRTVGAVAHRRRWRRTCPSGARPRPGAVVAEARRPRRPANRAASPRSPRSLHRARRWRRGSGGG